MFNTINTTIEGKLVHSVKLKHSGEIETFSPNTDSFDERKYNCIESIKELAIELADDTDQNRINLVLFHYPEMIESLSLGKNKGKRSNWSLSSVSEQVANQFMDRYKIIMRERYIELLFKLYDSVPKETICSLHKTLKQVEMDSLLDYTILDFLENDFYLLSIKYQYIILQDAKRKLAECNIYHMLICELFFD